MLIEIWRNAILCEGVERGRSLNELSDETGLSEEEVVQRESRAESDRSARG